MSAEFERHEGIFVALADSLDIPDHVYEDAILKYEDIADWLSEATSDLLAYDPKIYPQGSFRLGTVVRPLNDSEEIDVDLVCHLSIEKGKITQAELKVLVGKRLKEREDLKIIISPGRRVWVLNYPNSFHMDVLPAIPNVETAPDGILITDTKLLRWQKSNPIAYADWFSSKMRKILLENRIALAKSLNAEVEDVPEWKVKTPLQRLIQILKRHRDYYFSEDPEHKPISIIITTLAAHAYNNQVNLGAALIETVKRMPTFIENRDGKWWIQNPVDKDENFADKWNETPKKHESFVRWMADLQSDLLKISSKRDPNEVFELLAPRFGEQTLAKAASSIGIPYKTGSSIAKYSAPKVPALGSVAHKLPAPWPINIRYKATISATVHNKQGGLRKLWALTNNPVPPNVWLRFKVATNVPEPYEVKWQVVNTGQEAAKVQGLRGGFENCNLPGNNVRWERTEYLGTHTMEGFIIKDGVCVARTEPKLVKIKK